MPVKVTGISHKTAPIAIRERLALAPVDSASLLNNLSLHGDVSEAAIVSTCNRTEIYYCETESGRFDATEWLCQQHNLPSADYSHYFYDHSGRPAVAHLLRVAAGLDSLVVGEPQIVGQLKQAHALFRDNRETAAASKRTIIDRLFQRAYATSKRVRSETEIGRNPVSVAFTAVTLAKQIFSRLSKQKVLLIGAGEMIELCARHLHQQGITQLVIANRSLDKAEAIAKQYSAKAASLSQLDDYLNADIIISSTASRRPIIQADTLQKILKERRFKPMFLVDLAVPRDIAPEAAKLSDIYLYTIDDLQQVVTRNQKQRLQAAQQAEIIIQQETDSFLRWLHGQQAGNTLQQLHSKAMADGQILIERALAQIQAGRAVDETLQNTVHALVKKMLHHPSEQLRQAAEEQRYELIELAEQLFNLNRDQNRDTE